MQKISGKKNCWEFMKCGREENGERVNDLGTCPSALEKRLDGVHGGTNGGRGCWVVTGTLCRGVIQGTFAQKFKSCRTCDFYIYVREGEPDFQLSAVLLRKLG